MTADAEADRELARVVRDEAGRLVATLARRLGDLDLAEESVAEAVAEALPAWRRDGLPSRPGAWLATAARRNAVDRIRRERAYREKLALLPEASSVPTPVPGSPPVEPDDRLPLVFTCCHPALSREAQIALTLRAVLGLTTGQIARAFLVPETTVLQRITRAKRKIVTAAIPVRMPEPDELADRLSGVLTVVYLTYNEGYLTTAGPEPSRRDLAEDAVWLATLVATALPREPEALGLLALLVLLHARERARFHDGRIVLLPDQDRALWDRRAIAEGVRLVERAAALRRPGRFQLQAAIAAVHAEAPDWRSTDWPQILALYDLLLAHDGSPVVRLNRAIALGRARSAGEALAEIDTLAGPLGGYHLFHAARAEVLRALGRPDEAREEDRAALRLTANVAERALLQERIGSTRP